MIDELAFRDWFPKAPGQNVKKISEVVRKLENKLELPKEEVLRRWEWTSTTISRSFKNYGNLSVLSVKTSTNSGRGPRQDVRYVTEEKSDPEVRGGPGTGAHNGRRVRQAGGRGMS